MTLSFMNVMHFDHVYVIPYLFPPIPANPCLFSVNPYLTFMSERGYPMSFISVAL